MLENLVIQFTKFPGAEIIHSLQGAVVGILLVKAYCEKCVAQAWIAFTILVGFAIYEGYERWRIGDEADIDFQVFLIMMWVTILGPIFYYTFRSLLNTYRNIRSK